MNLWTQSCFKIWVLREFHIVRMEGHMKKNLNIALTDRTNVVNITDIKMEPEPVDIRDLDKIEYIEVKGDTIRFSESDPKNVVIDAEDSEVTIGPKMLAGIRIDEKHPEYLKRLANEMEIYRRAHNK